MSADVIRVGSQTHSPELEQREALRQDFAQSREVDLNAADANGVTPLMRAVCDGRVEETQELLNRGADVNARRGDGFTPLLLAAFHGHTEVVRVLLEHGADATATCRYSTSADMWANARGFFGIAENLREALSTKQSETTSDRMVETEKGPNADEGLVTNAAAEVEVRVAANELFAPVLVTSSTRETDAKARPGEPSEETPPNHLTAEMDNGAICEEPSSEPSVPNTDRVFLEAVDVARVTPNSRVGAATEWLRKKPTREPHEDLQYEIEDVDLAFWMAPEDLNTGAAEKDQEEVQTRFPEEQLDNVGGSEDGAALQAHVSDGYYSERVTEPQTKLQTEVTEESNTETASERELSLPETRFKADLNTGRAAEIQTESQPPVQEEMNREIATVNQAEAQARVTEGPKQELVAESQRLTRAPQESKNKEISPGNQVKRVTRVLDEHWEAPELVAIEAAPAFRPGQVFMSRMTSLRGIALIAVAAIIVCGVTTYAIVKITGGFDAAAEKPAVNAAVEKPAVNVAVDRPAINHDSNVDKPSAVTKADTTAPSWINGLVESGAAGNNEPDANPAIEVLHKEAGPEVQASSIGSEVNHENQVSTLPGFANDGSSRGTRRSVRRSSSSNRSQTVAPSVAETGREREGERSKGATDTSEYNEAKASGEVRDRTVKNEPRTSIQDGSQTVSGSGSSKPKSKVIQWP